MNSKKEKIIILGTSGSGKSFLMRKLIEKGLNPCIKWTTRPMRKYEEQGIDYNFVSTLEFFESINKDKFLTHQKFIVTPKNSLEQTWFYGITLKEFDNSQVFIMTPGEFKDVTEDSRKECFVVYLDIDRNIRESRLYKRDDKNDSIKRRLDSDDIDFENPIDYDLRITDPDFGVDDIYNLMA
jgi:guanylate kinase